MSEPFPSLGQLLSVLPPQSAVLLPKTLGELMTDPSSPLVEFYPKDFTTDANGKRQSWEAVTKIPFIQAGSLLNVLTSVVDAKGEDGTRLLTNAKKRRNMRGTLHTFVSPNFGHILILSYYFYFTQ